MHLTPAMITIDCADARELAQWWATALDTEIAQDFGDFLVVGAKPIVLGFQQVPEPRVAKNRVHVDFTTEDRTAAVERLVGLGATVVDDHSAPGMAWTTMRDPAGNEFCVA